jgi:hypothetical protein
MGKGFVAWLRAESGRQLGSAVEGSSTPVGARHPEDWRLLGEFVGALLDALFDHDSRLIHGFLRMPAAARLPREVREEALAFCSLPPGSMRAPLAALQFAYRLRQLEVEASRPEEPSAQSELFGNRQSGDGGGRST